jgi:hypothetical protein
MGIGRCPELSNCHQHGEIAFLVAVSGKAAQQCVPHMPVSFDKSGQGNRAFAADRGSGRRVERLPNGHDPAIPYMDVTAGNVAECRVHRHHIGVADDEFAARR